MPAGVKALVEGKGGSTRAPKPAGIRLLNQERDPSTPRNWLSHQHQPRRVFSGHLFRGKKKLRKSTDRRLSVVLLIDSAYFRASCKSEMISIDRRAGVLVSSAPCRFRTNNTLRCWRGIIGEWCQQLPMGCPERRTCMTRLSSFVGIGAGSAFILGQISARRTPWALQTSSSVPTMAAFSGSSASARAGSAALLRMRCWLGCSRTIRRLL